MQYVALLRGINVGGNAKVAMPLLKQTFERAGFTEVKTYINSGNVIFSSGSDAPSELCENIEVAIHQDFGFGVPVLVTSADSLREIVAKTPESWQNNSEMKTDVMFLWEAVDSPDTLKQLRITPGMDDVVYHPGAIVWRVDREHQAKSGMLDIVGTKLYKQMTVRNINTVRKLVELMEP